MEEHDRAQSTDLVACNEYIELKSRMHLVEMCEEASRLPALPLGRRQELLTTISASVDPLPVPFQVTILVAAVQSLKWTKAADVEAWIQLAKPFADQGRVSPHFGLTPERWQQPYDFPFPTSELRNQSKEEDEKEEEN